jgi:acetoacetate decarboxylase
MGLVKTPDEIARLQAITSKPKALRGEMVSVVYRTRPEIVAHLLPPGLEPAAEPTGIAYVGRWEQSSANAYSGGSLFLRARHGDLEGDYCLAMPVEPDAALLFGREMMGEPKKLCSTAFERSGDTVRGELFRYGRSILAIEVTIAQDLPPTPFDSAQFHYKTALAADGRGLEWDPLLVRMETHHEPTRLALGSGTLRLGSTPHDDFSEIEVLALETALYTEGDMRGRARVLTSVDRDAFLPYAFARYDDWTRLANEAPLREQRSAAAPSAHQ